MRRVLLMFLAAWSLTSVADPIARDRLETMLSGYEFSPPDTLLDLDDAQGVLIEMADDPELPGYVRSRALSMLALHPGDDAWRFLEDRLRRANGVERRRVLDVICAGFGSRAADRVEIAVGPLLDHAEDAHLRARAAHCFRRLTTESAAVALERYRLRVGDTWEARAAGFVSE